MDMVKDDRPYEKMHNINGYAEKVKTYDVILENTCFRHKTGSNNLTEWIK